MAERAANDFAAYIELVSAWGNPLVFDPTIANHIVDNLEIVFAALRKLQPLILNQLLSIAF